MRIDSHQHFWQYSPVSHPWMDDSMECIKRDFLPPDIAPLLKASNIDGCIAVQAAQTNGENAFLLSLSEQYDFVKGVIGWVDLCSDNLSTELETLSQHPKFKGVRHIVQSEADGFLLKNNFLSGVKKLKDFSLIYEILVFERQLSDVITFISNMPDDQIFVLDHIAKPRIKDGLIQPWEKLMRQLARYPNLHVKVSGMVTEANIENWCYEDITPYLDVVFDAFGVERLMYGSDWPVSLLATEYENTVFTLKKYMKQIVLPPQQQSQIMGSNAVTVYGLLNA